jgi:hypothetical protein
MKTYISGEEVICSSRVRHAGLREGQKGRVVRIHRPGYVVAFDGVLHTATGYSKTEPANVYLEPDELQ